MILSNVEIHRAIDEGRLKITPEPSPRFPSLEQPNCPFDSSSVNLKLSNTVSIPKTNKPFTFDLRQGGISEFLAEAYDEVDLSKVGSYTLQPNKFILSNTLEFVELPINQDGTCLAARVEGRSSFARCGLIVHFTAPTIHAGFGGKITLEMINLGTYPITLYPGQNICQLILEEVRGIPIQNPSEFQGQTKPSGKK